MNKVLLLFLTLTLLACQKKDTAVVEEADGVVRPLACVNSELEAQMTSILSKVSTDTDFSLMVERRDGRVFSYNRGSSTMDTLYESASTSKLVSAVIILRLVDQGVLDLTDKPQKYITSWPLSSSDSLYNMNLAQLLSFTSGLETEPLCLNAGFSDFESCVNNIATTNSGNGIIPGKAFYYSSNHLQVAGLMAIKAKAVSSWQTLFSNFKTETGLFPTSTYDLPSLTNPRLAGGMHWKGREYFDFLRALSKGALLSSSMQAQLITDQTSSAAMSYSPAMAALGEDWHYGFGVWHECQSTTYNCTPGTRLSSPGAYGAYPFWDRQRNYFGMIARQGALGTFRNGAALERSIRTVLNDWSACSN